MRKLYRSRAIIPGDLADAILAEPFVPFRVVTLGGAVHEVHTPGQVVVAGPHALILERPGDPAAGSAEPRYDVVALRHVARLELISGMQKSE